MLDKHLIYISEDNFSLYISQQLNENGFIISLYDNQLGIEYELATYVGDRYYPNQYQEDKFMKYFFLEAKKNKKIKHEMITYIKSVNVPKMNYSRLKRIIKVNYILFKNKLNNFNLKIIS